MANPLASFRPVLDLLSQEAQFLPASGRALIELSMPNPEEIHDREAHPETRIQGTWETAPRGWYHSTPPIHRHEKHLFRFFGRGTTVVFFLGALLEQERAIPVQVAQIGAAILERRTNGAISPVRGACESRSALVVDTTMLSDVLRERIEEAMPQAGQLWNGRHNEHSSGSRESPEPRIRGAREANLRMRQLMRENVRNLDLHGEVWVVLGQSLGQDFVPWSGPPVVGVNANFRQDQLFIVRRNERSLYQLVAGLEPEYRTNVFPGGSEDHRGEVVFWYLRIRKLRGMDFPLAGVLRVEMPNPGGALVDTETVDFLSRYLVAERTVAPYGEGPQWHAQLYPLQLAERVVRGRFLSPEIVKASLRRNSPPIPSTFHPQDRP